MDSNKSIDGYRPMIQISLNKDGKKKLDLAPVAKDVLVSFFVGLVVCNQFCVFLLILMLQ